MRRGKALEEVVNQEKMGRKRKLRANVRTEERGRMEGEREAGRIGLEMKVVRRDETRRGERTDMSLCGARTRLHACTLPAKLQSKCLLRSLAPSLSLSLLHSLPLLLSCVHTAIALACVPPFGKQRERETDRDWLHRVCVKREERADCMMHHELQKSQDQQQCT